MREGIGLLQKCMQCFILIEQTICGRIKISITEFLDVPSFLPQCLAKAEQSVVEPFPSCQWGFSSGAMYPLQQAGQKRQGWMRIHCFHKGPRTWSKNGPDSALL